MLYSKNIEVLDYSKKTLLTVAIASGNKRFIYTYVRIVKGKSKDIKKALKAEYIKYNDNKEVICPHIAIRSGFRSNLTKSVIQLVPVKTFCMQNYKARTPLLLAVDYKKCTPLQVVIVTELLRCGPRALDIQTKDSLGHSYSV